MKRNEKRSEKELLLILLLVLTGLYGLGYLIGKTIAQHDESVIEVMQGIPVQTIGAVLAVLYLILTIVCNVLAVTLYFSVRKQVKVWDGENEAQIEKIERSINYPVILTSAMMIISLCLYSCSLYLLVGEFSIYIPMVFIAFFLSLAVGFAVQKKTIDLEKSLNPEKEGSLYDFRFEKRWMDSSDEAQKLIAYKAGYAGYKAGSFACMAMWLVSFIGSLLFHTGILPVICVCSIWLIMVCANMTASMKLEK